MVRFKRFYKIEMQAAALIKLIRYKFKKKNYISPYMHSHRLFRQLTKCTPRENFFSNRIAPIWNDLSPQIVQSASINGFKNRYDKSKLKSINATIAIDLPFSGLATV